MLAICLYHSHEHLWSSLFPGVAPDYQLFLRVTATIAGTGLLRVPPGGAASAWRDRSFRQPRGTSSPFPLDHVRPSLHIRMDRMTFARIPMKSCDEKKNKLISIGAIPTVNQSQKSSLAAK